MLRDLIDEWREDIIGGWRSELAGSDLLGLEPSAPRFTLTLSLNADSTAGFDFTIPDQPPMPPQPVPPFPIRWELSDKGILSIWMPIAPMPDYEMPDWSREEMCYDVLFVSGWSLALSNRRFDGEDIIVLRRLNQEEYDRRKAAEYGRMLDAMKQWTRGM